LGLYVCVNVLGGTQLRSWSLILRSPVNSLGVSQPQKRDLQPLGPWPKTEKPGLRTLGLVVPTLLGKSESPDDLPGSGLSLPETQNPLLTLFLLTWVIA
jgi:hypothetical protein